MHRTIAQRRDDAHHRRMLSKLFPFKFYDPIRKRWIQARYKATREDIAARYEKWEIKGSGWTPHDVDGRDRVPPDAGR